MKRRRRCGGGWLAALVVALVALREASGFSPPLPPGRHHNHQLHAPVSSSWQEDDRRRRQGTWTLPRTPLWEEEDSRRRRTRRRGVLGPLSSTTASSTSSSSSSSSSSRLVDRESIPAEDQSSPASASPPPSSRASSSSSSSSSSPMASATTASGTRKRKHVALTPAPPLPPLSPPSPSRASSAAARQSPLPQPPLSPAAAPPPPPPPQRRPLAQVDREEQRLLEQLEGLRRRRRRDEFRALTKPNSNNNNNNNQRANHNNNNGWVDVKRLKERGSTEVLEALVRAAAACQEVEVAWDVMREVLLRAQEVQLGEAAWVPRWDTFSTLMSACRRRRDLDLLLKSFKAALPFQGFSKTVLLNILLAGLCDQNRHMDVAAFYLETAHGKWGVMPNEVSWNTLLGAAARGGQHRLFEDLERKMAAQGVEGDVTTRNIRLQHLLAFRPGAGLALFERMKTEQEERRRERGRGGGEEEEAVMDLRTINIMAGHLSKTRGFDEAQAMLEEVARRGLGIVPRAVTHNILLDALLKAGRVDEALEYFYGVAGKGALMAGGAAGGDAGRRRSSTGRGGSSSSSSSSGGGGGGGRGKEVDPPVVDSTTYDILLNGLMQNGRVSTAVVVHEMMRKARLSPTIYTYAALIRLQKSATDVYRVWGQARSNCPRLSLPFLNLLVYELGQVHNDVGGALAAFRAILRMGRRPNTISFNSLFSALMKDANATLPAAGFPFGQQQQQTSSRKASRAGQDSQQQQQQQQQQVVLLEDEGAYYPTASSLSAEARGLLSLLDSLKDRTLLEAALAVLRSMYEEEGDNGTNTSDDDSSYRKDGGSNSGSGGGDKGLSSSSSSSSSSPSFSARPNARTFTILMAGISRAELGARGTALCVALYREAEAQGVRANGILCHALLRAFGTDAVGALGFFKRELRVRLKALDQVNPEEEREEEGEGEGEDETEEGREIDGVISAGGNLSLAYMALLYICGISGRPDLALQLLYAMQRDGLPSDRQAWEAFEAGKTAPGATTTTTTSVGQLLMGPYESLLRTEMMGLGWETGVTRVRIKF